MAPPKLLPSMTASKFTSHRHTPRFYAPAASPITSSPGEALAPSLAFSPNHPTKCKKNVQDANSNAPSLTFGHFAHLKTRPRHHDLISAAAHYPKTFIAVRDTPTSSFHLASVLNITETQLSIHYLGTTTPTLDTAVFRLVWISPDGRTVLKDSRPARNHTAVTGEIDTADIPDLLVASHLAFTTTGRLTRQSSRLLFHLKDQLHIY